MGYNILLTAISVFSIFHPIHISVCEMELDTERKALEISQRIFLDDLEKEIKKKRNEPFLDVLKPKNGMTSDEIFEEYLKDHLIISLNGKKEEYNYLGHEIEGNVAYFYVEIEKVRRLKEIKVQSTILTATYDDQVNLVHVEYMDNVRSLKLDTRKIVDALSY